MAHSIVHVAQLCYQNRNMSHKCIFVFFIPFKIAIYVLLDKYRNLNQTEDLGQWACNSTIHKLMS